MVSWMISVLSL